MCSVCPCVQIQMLGMRGMAVLQSLAEECRSNPGITLEGLQSIVKTLLSLMPAHVDAGSQILADVRPKSVRSRHTLTY
eukprot:1159468-Pelagomonas_calceolata.AAC.2